MAPSLRDVPDQKFPDLPAQNEPLLIVQAQQVLMALNIFQYAHGIIFLTFLFCLPEQVRQGAEPVDQSPHQVDDLGRGADGKGLAHGLAPHRHTRHQGGHKEACRPGPAEGKILDQLGRDHRRSRAGYHPADIPHHVVADGADPLGVAQKPDGLLGPGDLSGGHGVEGPLIGGGNGHAHDIKDNAHKDNREQDQKGGENTASVQKLLGDQGDHRGDKKRDQENGDDPTDRLIALFFSRVRVGFSHLEETLLIFK